MIATEFGTVLGLALGTLFVIVLPVGAIAHGLIRKR